MDNNSTAMLAMAPAVVNKGATLHISMANMATDFPEMEDQQTYLFGVVAIESARMRYDNRAVRAAFKASFENHDKAGLAEAVGQILFDMVVERAQCHSLPSTYTVLAAYWKLICARLGGDAKALDSDASLVRYVFARARHSVLVTDWTLTACGAALRPMSTHFIPKEIGPIECELASLDNIATAQDAANLAYRLLDLVGVTPNQAQDNAQEAGADQAQPPETGEAPPGAQAAEADSAQAEDASQAGDAQNGAQADVQDETDQGAAGEANQMPADGPADGDATTPSDSSAPGDAAPSAGAEGQTADAGEQLQEAGTESAPGDATVTDPLMEPAPQDQPTTPQLNGTALVPVPGNGMANVEFETKHRRGQELRSRILLHTMVASERLASVLKAQTLSSTRYAKRGHLVPSRLWKLRMGNVNVFRQTREGKELNTAIKILLDRSQSMNKTMQRAVEAACFLPMAFDDVEGIHTSIDIFPGCGDGAQTLKPFETRTTQCLDDLAAVKADGGTPLTEALRHSGRDLANFDAERRLLVVVTDGRPFQPDLAYAEIVALEKAGIEVIGISIKVSLKHLFSNYVAIQHVGELTNSLYHLMEEKLISDPLAA